MRRTEALVLVGLVATLPLLPSQVGCKGTDAATAPDDASDEFVYLPKRDAAPTGPGDAGDGGPTVKPPPPILPGCVGSSLPLEVAGERAYVNIPIGPPDAAVPSDFVVDFGTTGSTIDFGAFPDGGAPKPSLCYGDAGAPGADCVFNGFDFFGDWGTVTLRTADYSTIASLVRQAGILATDFLSLHPYTLDYTAGRIYRSDTKTFCTDAQLLGAGFAPLSSEGFFATDLKKLRPLHDVIPDPDASTAGFVVANVPTVPIAIAGVSALAQLDTGYDDRLIRHSINVNEALFARLSAQGADKLVRDELADVYLTTCVPGYSERVLAYRLAEGKTVDFIGQAGTVVRRENTAAIFVKTRTPELEKCGGVGTWTVPAAQVGSSFFIDAQAVVFDPSTSRVWVPSN